MQDLPPIPQLPPAPDGWSPAEIATWLWQILAAFFTGGAILVVAAARKWIKDAETREAELKGKIVELEKQITDLERSGESARLEAATLRVEKQHLEKQLADLQASRSQRRAGGV